MISLILFSNLVSCSTNQPFDIKSLKVWDLLVTHAIGQFGDEHYQVHAHADCIIMQANQSVRCAVKSGRLLGNPTFYFNIDDESIEMFDEALEHIATLSLHYLGNLTAYFKGATVNGEKLISGHVSKNSQNMIIAISSTRSDEVTMITGTTPNTLTPTRLFVKLIPALLIIFFFGFGKAYRKRFWKQFNQMNTNTLKMRISEAMNEK